MRYAHVQRSRVQKTVTVDGHGSIANRDRLKKPQVRGGGDGHGNGHGSRANGHGFGGAFRPHHVNAHGKCNLYLVVEVGP